jgi:hypothetical protein
VNEEREEREEKVDIKDIYFEIISLLIEYQDYDYDADKRGKMTIPKRYKTQETKQKK